MNGRGGPGRMLTAQAVPRPPWDSQLSRCNLSIGVFVTLVQR